MPDCDMSGLRRWPVGFPYGFWLCRAEYRTVLNARAYPSETGHRALLPGQRVLSKPAARAAAKMRCGGHGPPRISPGASRCPEIPRNPHPIPPALQNRGVFQQVPRKAVWFPNRLRTCPFFTRVLAQASDLHTPVLSLHPALDPPGLRGLRGFCAPRALPLTPSARRGRIRSVDS